MDKFVFQTYLSEKFKISWYLILNVDEIISINI